MPEPSGSVLRLRDQAPPRERFRVEVLRGLRRRPRQLPCKWFYDERGSELFERICELEEYYPTRTELGILERHVAEMAEALGPRCLVVEPGSGSGRKTRLLLDALEDPAGYVPVDIAREALTSSAADLAREFPGLAVLPVCGDFTADIALPPVPAGAARRALFFPGSTIGNFEPADAAKLLARWAAALGPESALLVGVDLVKDRDTLERAYDDAEGITAAFNRNLLARINRELGGDFDPDAFAHRALWNDEERRVEMHLVSRRAQTVTVCGERFAFEEGESIHTESSYKYGLDDFAELVRDAGLGLERTWTDEEPLFSMHLLAAA
jgi:dimethylhistidine N-methyltransferase